MLKQILLGAVVGCSVMGSADVIYRVWATCNFTSSEVKSVCNTQAIFSALTTGLQGLAAGGVVGALVVVLTRSKKEFGSGWNLINAAVLIGVGAFAASSPSRKLAASGSEIIVDNLVSYSGSLNHLFVDNSSLGVLAICAAEGNCTVAGQKTALYYGHTDPGNGRFNRGTCSDQGRGGNDLQASDQGCLRRHRSRIKRLVLLLRRAGIEPEQDRVAFINSMDLWNQASPRVSDAFPEKYKQALNAGLKGQQAILWARVEAFRLSSGELSAGNAKVGLFSICLHPSNSFYATRLKSLTTWSEKWRWKCIALDQGRRMRQIHLVLEGAARN